MSYKRIKRSIKNIKNKSENNSDYKVNNNSFIKCYKEQIQNILSFRRIGIYISININNNNI